MKKLNLMNGVTFTIINNKLTIDNIPHNYKFTNDPVEIFQRIVVDLYDDYYFEKIYKKYILNISNIDYLLEGCNKCLKYTEKIEVIIKNCCENPDGEKEYSILELLTRNIAYIKYFNQLDKLINEFTIINKLLNKEYKYIVTDNIYEFGFFIIYFFKNSITIEINSESPKQFKLLQNNLSIINELDYSYYAVGDKNHPNRYILLEHQSYKIFDNLLKYLKVILLN